MLKRGLMAAGFVLAALAINMVPAQAIPTGPHLTILNYFSDSSKTHQVGRYWSGCGEGHWGVKTAYWTEGTAGC